VSLTRGRVVASMISLAIVAVIMAGAWHWWGDGACNERPSMAALMQQGALGEKSQGRVDAPVTIIVYASLTCPHCARFATTVYPMLKARYIDTGKVRFIMRDAPLNDLALAAAILAHCVDDDQYFEFVQTLFRTQADWAFGQDPAAALLRIANQWGFTKESFERSLANRHVLEDILSVARRGQKFCAGSTPTFFINGNIHHGNITVDQLDQLLQPLLRT
jgi:protein-disulfide isomerase